MTGGPAQLPGHGALRDPKTLLHPAHSHISDLTDRFWILIASYAKSWQSGWKRHVDQGSVRHKNLTELSPQLLACPYTIEITGRPSAAHLSRTETRRAPTELATTHFSSPTRMTPRGPYSRTGFKQAWTCIWPFHGAPRYKLNAISTWHSHTAILPGSAQVTTFKALLEWFTCCSPNM